MYYSLPVFIAGLFHPVLFSCSSPVYCHTATNIPFMYLQTWFSPASLWISANYFQKKIKMFCLEIWYSGEKYSTRCSHSAVSIGTTYFQTELWIFNSTGDSYFQIKTIKMVPLICYFLFWSIDLGFGIEVWQIPFGIMHSKSQLNRGIFNVYFLN